MPESTAASASTLVSKMLGKQFRSTPLNSSKACGKGASKAWCMKSRSKKPLCNTMGRRWVFSRFHIRRKPMWDMMRCRVTASRARRPSSDKFVTHRSCQLGFEGFARFSTVRCGWLSAILLRKTRAMNAFMFGNFISCPPLAAKSATFCMMSFTKVTSWGFVGSGLSLPSFPPSPSLAGGAEPSLAAPGRVLRSSSSMSPRV
mmetsp:Transcript_100701/g.323342  ORF Transcript_100701/g.323342 Transcript_100701/m.323342 type:complete len:202 (-) Transcript_100701:569-1174(-)